MFVAFREPDYRRFWGAQFLSNIGSWMQGVAQGWLVYRLTDSPFLLGFVGFAATAPAIVLMLPGGVLADQLDRRKVIAWSQWAQAASALLLAVSIATGNINVVQIIGAALVVGIAQSFSAPAYQAMILDLLEERTRLPNAIAMNSLQFNLSRVVGPLLASVALTSFGSAACFFINAVSFLPLIFVLGRTKKRQQEHDAPAPMLERLREGFRYVRQDRLVLLLLAAAAAGSLFGYPIMSLMPVLARQLFRDDAAGTGFLIGALGCGALLAALTLSIVTPKRMLVTIVAATAGFGMCLAAAGWLMRTEAVVVLLIAGGVGMVMSLALCNTLIQQRTPDAMRGRVMSMYTFSWFAVVPFGNLIAGAIAEQRGIRVAMLVLGGGLMVTAVAIVAARERQRS
jgi:MFS family permease